jgi:hypothetical protein
LSISNLCFQNGPSSTPTHMPHIPLLIRV